ncbi:MAG: helix-turn-helix transcriptional regulator [Halioglobus sp.]|nr:helix-turn-helix transcriptional regulator [Halioglobus sp.]|tara:strand:- start:429 stop:1592 length:1164 start_codon:yes stop_codon:yes gene_type:complete
MSSARVDHDYDRLVGLVYEGAVESRPWQSTLPALREALDAQVASLILRPPSKDDQGVILNCVRPDSDSSATLADPNDWQASAYREEFFTLDPFINLPQDRVIALEDLLPDRDLVENDYYRHYLEPIGLFRILGVDTAEPGGMLARLRFARRRKEPRFRVRERELLQRLAPHLRRALEIYARLNRTTSERDVYAGAVNQLAVGTIILDEQGRLLSCNHIADALLQAGNGIALRDGRLHSEGRDINRELQEALTTIIRAQQQGETSLVRALRVPRQDARPDLGLIIRPAPGALGSEGEGIPAAAVFISDPEREESTSQQVLADLFSLTPAEARLATLLAQGMSLAEVSSAQGISQHTARAQLKSVFAKTGVSRQAELVRLVLKSAATLA